jgi:hypothetical protein
MIKDCSHSENCQGIGSAVIASSQRFPMLKPRQAITATTTPSARSEFASHDVKAELLGLIDLCVPETIRA